MKQLVRESWGIVAGLGLVLAAVVVATPMPVISQTGDPCLDDLAARHGACMEDADGLLDELRCDAAAAARLLACLLDGEGPS